jgi:cation diffusion facilitator CzcD-associated flavoprotein CzcO
MPGTQIPSPGRPLLAMAETVPLLTPQFSQGPAIQNYIKQTVKEWNLDRDIYLDTRVVAAQWQEAAGEWKVTVENEGKQREEYCDILISGQGVLV